MQHRCDLLYYLMKERLTHEAGRQCAHRLPQQGARLLFVHLLQHAAQAYACSRAAHFRGVYGNVQRIGDFREAQFLQIARGEDFPVGQGQSLQRLPDVMLVKGGGRGGNDIIHLLE